VVCFAIPGNIIVSFIIHGKIFNFIDDLAGLAKFRFYNCVVRLNDDRKELTNSNKLK
jgi:hypothetical protein